MHIFNKINFDFKMKFEDIGSIATSYTGGWFRRSPHDANRSSGHLGLTRSVKDVEADTARVVLDTFFVSGESDDEIFQLSSTEINKYAVYDVPQSGTKRVIVGNPTTDNKIFIDIESNRMNMRIEVSGIHGKVAADSWFGGCSWSHDERYFCYVAQPLTPAWPQPTSVPVAKEAATTPAKTVQETKFDYKGGDWGEKYVSVSQFVLCVLDTTTGQVRTLPGVDTENGCPSQPVFVSRNGKYGIVYTYWSTKPRRMGILMCYHRKCSLYHVDITDLLADPVVSSATEKETVQLTHTCITPNIALARSPRFNNSISAENGCLVFLGRTIPMQTHNGGFQLLAIDVVVGTGGNTTKFAEPRVAVDLVTTPITRDGEMSFPGLFCDQLPRRCFVTDFVVAVNTAWGSSDAVIVVAVAGCCLNHITRLTCLLSILPEESQSQNAIFASCSVIEAVGYGPTEASDLLFVASRPNCPPQFGIYSHQFAPSHTGSSNVRLSTDRDNEETLLQHGCVIASKFMTITSTVTTVKPESLGGVSISEHYNNVRSLVSDLRWSVLQFSGTGSEKSNDSIPFDAIILHPSTDAEGSKALPVVVVPHGGPHSVFTTNFSTMAPYVYLALSLRACIVLVNYRGSVGFGVASVESLPGRIGDQDLQDMLTVMSYLQHDDTANSYRYYVKLDFTRCCILGGSHGGFLTATAIGKHPKLFKAAAMRNPVTNIPAMYTVSDIPDWCIVECMGCSIGIGAESESDDNRTELIAIDSYDFDQFSTPNQVELAAMYTKSPMQYIPHVQTPTLLLLGAKDRRVPMCQGIEYYHALKHAFSSRARTETETEATTQKKIEVKCMVFPEDSHAIDSPGSEVSSWTAIKEWFDLYVA